MKKKRSGKEKEEGDHTVGKEEVLSKAPSAYEAVVAIAKEARRLNTAPEVFLEGEEKAIPKAVKNFMEGKVQYEIEEDGQPAKKGRKKSRKPK